MFDDVVWDFCRDSGKVKGDAHTVLFFWCKKVAMCFCGGVFRRLLDVFF